MTDTFFERPILNSPYEYPHRHWELDDTGQPTQHVLPQRRPAKYVSPIPKPKKQKKRQREIVFQDENKLSTEDQQYETTRTINELRERITREWLDDYLICKRGTFPAQIMYLTLADIACEKITAAITRGHADERPMPAILDPDNPAGSTRHISFNTSKTDRWQTDPCRCHVNWVITDSEWEAQFCQVAEAHPRVCAYVKNHSLGFEVPYEFGSESRRYRPDFIVRVDDGHGEGRSPQPRRGDQGLPRRRREREEVHDGHLLGAGRESPRRLGPLGVRGAHRRLDDGERLRLEGGEALQRSDRQSGGGDRLTRSGVWMRIGSES